MYKVLEKRLPELIELESLIEKVSNRARVRVLTEVSHDDHIFPVYSIEIGSEDPTSPCFMMVGGVHGLERIGSLVCLSTLRTVIELLAWDHTHKARLNESRLIFVPLLNPVGMFRRSRSNGNNVDLMRNAPVYSEEATRFLYGGHRISPKIPFYRGALADGLEKENKALCDFIEERVFPAKTAICLDVHSGFGATDRLWFPYARTKKPFPYFVEAYAFRELLNNAYPHHLYSVEPQSIQYTTHGDLWDYLFDMHYRDKKDQFFLPLTLELGSWKWVRKNPKQIFDLLGVWNPILPHRRARVLRDHKTFVDFLHRAVLSRDWIDLPEDKRQIWRFEALNLWYGGDDGTN
ncbi:MAG: DUF2817 domain-containing protein [Bdellovibrionales bacterium]|nr:DUF2817 domain-containing protein [Bdellovibrionales bacterium]MCB0408541.1 DUF2817 domain-containing protein [Bdellovibrionales bacterium]